MLEPGCRPKCPGCAHRSLAYSASLQQKTDWLKYKLRPWQDRLQAVQAATNERRFNYRDRLCLSTQWQKGIWHFGLWRGDELIDIPECPVHSKRARKVISLLRAVLPPPERFPLRFYVQSAAQISLIVKSKNASTKWLTADLCQSLQQNDVEGLWLHCNPAAGNNLFLKNGWRLLWGTPRSQDNMGLWYGPGGFQQLMPELYEQALSEARTFLMPGEGDTVIDLYCGGGASLRSWVDSGANGIGVELSGEAIDCAQRNVPQARLLRGKCIHRLPQLQALTAFIEPRHRLLYVNPPRTGLEAEVLAWIMKDYRPVRMVYLSCSAGTLRRDLEILSGTGYQVAHITPYDFFPQTQHVETLALLKWMGSAG